jgi:phosphoribosylanthranilate isomerase
MMGGRVKICGLTRVADLEAALDCGAYAVGFVFARSPRQVAPGSARELSLHAAGRAVRVGLFMDQPAAVIREVLSTVPLDMLQFHGTEPNDFCGGFGLPFLKAIPMAGAGSRSEVKAYPDAEGLLLDSHAPGAGGGSGTVFDWTQVPRCPLPIWLAGGLNAGNVADAIRQVRPWAVDVSSGVEQSPGMKSREKIEAFMHAVAMATESQSN